MSVPKAPSLDLQEATEVGHRFVRYVFGLLRLPLLQLLCDFASCECFPLDFHDSPMTGSTWDCIRSLLKSIAS